MLSFVYSRSILLKKNDLFSRQPSPSDSMIRTIKHIDKSSNSTSFPSNISRKPIRIVKAVQRSDPSTSTNNHRTSSPMKMNSENNLKAISLNNSHESMMNHEHHHHHSSDYVRNLFPISDRLKRNCSRQNSTTNNIDEIRTISNDNIQQTVNNMKNFFFFLFFIMISLLLGRCNVTFTKKFKNIKRQSKNY